MLIDTLDTSSQATLEKEFAKNHMLPLMRESFTETFAETIAENGLPVEFGVEAMAQVALHRRCSFETLAGILWRFVDDLAPETAAQELSAALTKMLLAEFFGWDSERRQFVVTYGPSEEDWERLAQFQYPMPMIEHPRTVRHNKENGYFTFSSSILLRNNHHDDDVCLDHINRMNSIPLSINPTIVAFMRNSWADLDHQKEDETEEEFHDRIRAFQKYDRASKDVIDALMAQGNRFWLTHRYDKRGRTYAQG